MEDLLFRIEITPQTFYLAIILVIIGRALKDIPFIKKWMIIWILIFISIIVQFVFVGISFRSFFEAILISALSTITYQTYKQTLKGIREIKTKKAI